MDFFESIRGLVGGDESQSGAGSFFSDALGLLGEGDDSSSGITSKDLSGLTGGSSSSASQDLASTSRLLEQGFINIGKKSSAPARTGEPKGSVDIATIEREWLRRMQAYSQGAV